MRARLGEGGSVVTGCTWDGGFAGVSSSGAARLSQGLPRAPRGAGGNGGGGGMAAASGDALSSGQADASSGTLSLSRSRIFSTASSSSDGGGDRGGGARRRRGGGLGDGAGAGAGGLAKSRCDGAPPDHSVSGAASGATAGACSESWRRRRADWRRAGADGGAGASPGDSRGLGEIVLFGLKRLSELLEKPVL